MTAGPVSFANPTSPAPALPGRRTRWLVVAGIATAAAVLTWLSLPSHERFFTDADTIKEPRETTARRDVLWQPPTPISFDFSTSTDFYEPRLSADGLTMYFVRGKAGLNASTAVSAANPTESGADIVFSHRTPEGWTPPQPVPGISGPADELGPEPSLDERALYFYSNRDGGSGGYDIWVARRAETSLPFADPINLGAAVNSPYNEYGPAVTRDGECLYFASNRPPADDDSSPPPESWKATLREDLFSRTYDLYVANLAADGPGRARSLANLNTAHNEGSPAISPSGDFLYFASDRPGGYGGFDLYRSRRVHGTFANAVNLGVTINASAHELDPALSLGGFGLHFSSDRTPADAEPRSNHPYQIYFSASREVFLASQVHRAAIDWGAIWSAVGPSLLWSLFALLILLCMLALLRAARDRRLSLIVRCLLGSVALHLLLVLAFTVWQVSAGLAGIGSRRGDIRVALSDAVHGSADIHAQVRGALTSVPDLSYADFAASPPAPSITLPAHWRALETPIAAAPSDTTSVPQEMEFHDATPQVRILLTTAQLVADRNSAHSFAIEPPSAPPQESQADPSFQRWSGSEQTTDQPPRPAVMLNPSTNWVLMETTVSSETNSASSRSVNPAMDFGAFLQDAHPDTVSPSPVALASWAPDVPSPAFVHPLPTAGPALPEISDGQAEKSIPAPTFTAFGNEPMPRPGFANIVLPAWRTVETTTASDRVMTATPPSDNLSPREFSEAPDAPRGLLETGWLRDSPLTTGLAPDPMRISFDLPSETPPMTTAPPTESVIHGKVINMNSGQPIAGAVIRLDTDAAAPILVVTDTDGAFSLTPPDLPDHVALSATAEGFLPASLNVAARRLKNGGVRVYFRLRTQTPDEIAIEAVPDVHHLGDNRFTGAINSQFQKRSEGRRFRAIFTLTTAQWNAVSPTVELRLLAKGVQTRHRLRINDQTLPQRLVAAPNDGSFGEFVTSFPGAILKEGENTLEVYAGAIGDDVDDFEFVNVQITLRTD